MCFYVLSESDGTEVLDRNKSTKRLYYVSQEISYGVIWGETHPHYTMK